ncbi:C-C chemokine receptor type 2 [Rhinophrynus dorsalis]
MNFTKVTTDRFPTTEYYNVDDYSPCQKEDIKQEAARFITIMYILVFLLGFIGNTLVILILIRYKKLKNMTDIYLLNLAISDLLFVFSLPFWAYYIANDWPFGNALCKLFSGVYLIGFYGASFFIILLTLDRYLAIVHAVFAMKARTIKSGIITSTLLWLIAILPSLPGFIFYKTQRQDDTYTCSPYYTKKWKLFCTFMMNILGLVIPLVVMIFCYTKIIYTLLRCRNEKKKHKAVTLIFIIMIVFLLFWMPYNIVYIIYSFQDSEVLNNCETSKKLDVAIMWAEAISYFHCCLNPIIYAFVGEKFRKYLCIFLQTILPNCHVCPVSSVGHMQIHERHSSLYTPSTGEHDISAVL